MSLSQIVNVRRWAAAGAAAVMLWCGQAHAQVLDQVPSNALGVVEIRSLDKMNAKVANMAKAFGLDQLQPQLKDPLGALLEKAKLIKGIDKAGDAALAILAPTPDGSEPEPIGLVPVSDYQAFLGNFQKVADGDITEVIDPGGHKHMFIAHHGKYAVMSDKKENLGGKVGITLGAAAAHEVNSKDAAFLFNMPVVRSVAIPALKGNRGKIIEKMHEALAEEAKLKQFIPVFDTVINEVLDGAETFLNDADAIVFSVEIGDAGLTSSALIDFSAQSKLGKTVAECKPGTTPLLAGLPDRKYFIFGGGSSDPAVTGRLAEEWINPIIKDLNGTNTDIGKQIAGVLESAKVVASSANHTAMGWVVPTKPLGQDSLFQEFSVTYGNAAKIAGAEKKLLSEINDLMALAPQNQGVKTKIEFGEVKAVDGAQLQSYTTKMDFDPNDPKGMQAQQMLSMLYGPKGMSGAFGPVNDNTFIIAQGVDDELLKEVIASAKASKDVLSDSEHVKAVSSHLPSNRTAVYYVALDNIVGTVVRYAQGFGVPIKMKLPQNLPPIGASVGTDGSSVRFDSFVPTETVQSLIAAGIQAYTQMQAGGGGGL
jgi:hypothetical protein